MRFGTVFLILAACASAQLLTQAREKMMDTLVNQPNYTCLETVERTRQAPGGGLSVQDTLRLEVALVEGKEMFAWPGAKEFQDRDIRELVSTGMFGNGNYGLYIRMIFSGSGPAFTQGGTVNVNGIATTRYDFRVRAGSSGYHLSVGGNDAIVGFHGSVYIDPSTADLRRLEVFADDIPPELGLTAAEDRIDYARLRIGDDAFLLPVESNLYMASKESVSRNHVRFSGCRKFTGESSVIFDDAELTETTAAVIDEFTLPPDTLLAFELTSDIHLDRAAIGDSITAKLASDVKRGKEKLIAKGAIATGRVVAVERTRTYYAIQLQFQDLNWNHGHAPIQASFERMGGLTLAGRPAVRVSVNGTIQTQPTARNLRGETVFYRTVR
jgi:hypothetical protein